MKKDNVVNRVRINRHPNTFEEVYKGECNGDEFNLTYMGRYNAGTEEMETAISIVWKTQDDPEDSNALEEGIRKLFKKRLDERRDEVRQ